MMNKYVFTLLVIFGLLVFASPSVAYFVGSTNVGDVDTIIAKASLGNSGTAEDKWLADNGFVVVKEYDGPELKWTNVEGSIWAAQLYDSPGEYFIKIGTGGTSINNSHFIYQNNTALTWAVIDLAGWGGGISNNINVGRISHVGEGVSVPEPSLLLFLGAGLVAVGIGVRRKAGNSR